MKLTNQWHHLQRLWWVKAINTVAILQSLGALVLDSCLLDRQPHIISNHSFVLTFGVWLTCICVQVFCGRTSSYFWNGISKSGITESYGNSLFNILRSCQNGFQSGCSIFTIPLANFSTSSPIPVIVCLFKITTTLVMKHSVHRGFGLHIPEDCGCWATFSCTYLPLVCLLWGSIYSNHIFCLF